MRNALFAEQQNALEQDMAPFGFMDDGLNETETETDEYGDVWHPVDVVRQSVIFDTYKQFKGLTKIKGNLNN